MILYGLVIQPSTKNTNNKVLRSKVLIFVSASAGPFVNHMILLKAVLCVTVHKLGHPWYPTEIQPVYTFNTVICI